MRRNNVVLAIMMMAAPLVFASPLSGRGPVWDAPLLFEDAGNYAPFRADAWPGPLMRTVEVDASALNGPFALTINGRRIWKTEDFVDVEAGGAIALRSTTTNVFRFYSTDTEALSTVVSNGREVAGYFETPGERWVLYPLEGKTHLLVREDEAPFTCAVASASVVPAKRRSASSGSPNESLEIAEWKLGLWYNPRFAERVGGDDKAKLLLQLFADTENTALIETGNTYARVTLALGESVAVAGVGGAEATDYSTVKDVYDGLFKFCNDPALRQKRYDRKISLSGYIDAVSTSSTGLAGLYEGGKPDKDSGTFSVFFGSAVTVHTIIHEIGHALGLQHDLAAASPPIRKGTLGFFNCRGEVKDVMVAAAGCFARDKLFYSNPVHWVAGAPFGSEDSDAAAIVRRSRFVIRDEFPLHVLEGNV